MTFILAYIGNNIIYKENQEYISALNCQFFAKACDNATDGSTIWWYNRVVEIHVVGNIEGQPPKTHIPRCAGVFT